MISHTTQRFRDCFSGLPADIQKRAQDAYAHFRDNPRHPGLRFKKVHDDPDVYSARISRDYRALGVLERESIIWFWIGSHSDYVELLKKLSP